MVRCAAHGKSFIAVRRERDAVVWVDKHTAFSVQRRQWRHIPVKIASTTIKYYEDFQKIKFAIN